METDADRLATIQGLGGQLVSAPRGTFWAILDAEYAAAGDLPAVEGTAPALTCRTSDFKALQIVKNDSITVGDETFKFVRHEPDGTGISVLVLRR